MLPIYDYDYDYDSYGHGGAVAAVYLLFLGFFAFYVLVIAGYYVLNGFAFMSFYRKVGVKPWIAWVPYFNQFTWLQVGGHLGWFILLALVPFGGIVVIVFLAIGMYRTGIAMSKPPGFVVLGIFFPFAWAFVMGAKSNVYRPELITAAGYPAPLSGFGSMPNFTNADYVPPAAP